MLTNLLGSVTLALILSRQLFCKVTVGSKCSVMRQLCAVAARQHDSLKALDFISVPRFPLLSRRVLDVSDLAATVHKACERNMKKKATSLSCCSHDGMSLLFELEHGVKMYSRTADSAIQHETYCTTIKIPPYVQSCTSTVNHSNANWVGRV